RRSTTIRRRSMISSITSSPACSTSSTCPRPSPSAGMVTCIPRPRSPPCRRARARRRKAGPNYFRGSPDGASATSGIRSTIVPGFRFCSIRATLAAFPAAPRKWSAIMRPFEGIRVIDVTHVLAGPFATYQLAVLGADVIKVEHPDEPDQSRGNGTDKALNRRNMGTSFLTQASNKRAITLDLKQPADREVLKKLAATADIFVENYRPGAFEALGLGYETPAAIHPRLIYASFSPFGQHGPRGPQTAYDHVIQASSGIMAMTGTEDVHPIKFGAPAIDYATGMTGAFALASALFQRERT